MIMVLLSATQAYPIDDQLCHTNKGSVVDGRPLDMERPATLRGGTGISNYASSSLLSPCVEFEAETWVGYPGIKVCI